jgi:benzodiazapine receptor
MKADDHKGGKRKGAKHGHGGSQEAGGGEALSGAVNPPERVRRMNPTRSIIGLTGWLAISLCAGWVGSRFTPGPWYASLTKPTWTPPGALFAPVWTILYLLMGVAAWLVWRRGGFAGAGLALGIFIIQLILNGLWSYLFFGLHRIGLALLEMAILWVAILVVTVLFWRHDRRGGMLLVPYGAWVGFAWSLNFALWRLNG